MGERKVLNKYFDPNFNPKWLPKRQFRSTQCIVTMMMPFSMRCSNCGAYSNVGTKFNMRMEECKGEDYLGIVTYRFFFKCRSCFNNLSFKTDPKNHDYVVEHGGVRSYDAWRDMHNAERTLEEQREQDEEGNAMRYLENRTSDSKREMDILDAIDETQHLNKRKQLITPDELLKTFVSDPIKKLLEEEMQEVQKAFISKHVKRLEDDEHSQEEPVLIEKSEEIPEKKIDQLQEFDLLQEKKLFSFGSKIKIKSKQDQTKKGEEKSPETPNHIDQKQQLKQQKLTPKNALLNFDYSDDSD